MKFKPITALFTAGVLALTITGCSREEDFDASGYTAAYLDGVLKGDSSAYQTLAGEKAEDLEALHSQYLASQTERILEIPITPRAVSRFLQVCSRISTHYGRMFFRRPATAPLPPAGMRKIPIR